MTGAIWGVPSFSARVFNTGASDEAKKLEGFLASALTSYRQLAPRDAALADLWRVYSEGRADGWDGYSAKAISSGAYHCAVRVLLALPTAAPIPDIVPEPDGEISLEWDYGQWNALSLSIGDGGRLAYAAMLGRHRRETGSEIFDDVVSPEILSTLWKVSHK